MKVEKIVVRRFGENCYIASDDNRNAFIVDPGGDVDIINEFIQQNNLVPSFIILTHGHGDHIDGVPALREKYNIPVIAHEDEKVVLENVDFNYSKYLNGSMTLDADRFVKDGEVVDFFGSEIKIFHTPGHTQGGMCMLIEGVLFTGDTIFKGSIGRYDLPTADYDSLMNSLGKIVQLPDETIIMAGHGPDTTVGFEKSNNPFIKSN